MGFGGVCGGWGGWWCVGRGGIFYSCTIYAPIATRRGGEAATNGATSRRHMCEMSKSSRNKRGARMALIHAYADRARKRTTPFRRLTGSGKCSGGRISSLNNASDRRRCRSSQRTRGVGGTGRVQKAIWKSDGEKRRIENKRAF